MRIKNKTGSPYHLVDKDGNKIMLPAFGTVDIDPHPMHEGHYRLLGYFDIIDSPKDDKRDLLRREYFDKSGKEADSRWGESRLRSEIERLSKEGDE